MNFLAHLYLSGENDDIRLGNLIGDFVKGKDYDKYPPLVRKGILIHRKIDSFTDAHPIVRKHKTLFSPRFHKYSGIVTDIIYDHFLADEWLMFSDVKYEEYLDNVHEGLMSRLDMVTDEMQYFINKFVKNKWLKSYDNIEGIRSVLIGMSKGTSLPPEAEFGILILKNHYRELRHDFLDYFPQLIAYINEEMDKME